MVHYNKKAKADLDTAVMQVVETLSAKCGHKGNGFPYVYRSHIHLVLDYNGTFNRGTHDGVALSGAIDRLVSKGKLIKVKNNNDVSKKGRAKVKVYLPKYVNVYDSDAQATAIVSYLGGDVKVIGRDENEMHQDHTPCMKKYQGWRHRATHPLGHPIVDTKVLQVYTGPEAKAKCNEHVELVYNALMVAMPDKVINNEGAMKRRVTQYVTNKAL